MRTRVIAAALLLIGVTALAIGLSLDQGALILELLNTMSQAGTAGMPQL
ncbi:MAG: hypothetical protein ACTSW4_00915 [Candidatus Ranarchaeia archaeon]